MDVITVRQINCERRMQIERGEFDSTKHVLLDPADAMPKAEAPQAVEPKAVAQKSVQPISRTARATNHHNRKRA